VGHFLKHLSTLLGRAKDDPLGSIEMVVLLGILGFILDRAYEITVTKPPEIEWFNQPIVGLAALFLFGVISLKVVLDYRRNSRDR